MNGLYCALTDGAEKIKSAYETLSFRTNAATRLQMKKRSSYKGKQFLELPTAIHSKRELDRSYFIARYLSFPLEP